MAKTAKKRGSWLILATALTFAVPMTARGDDNGAPQANNAGSSVPAAVSQPAAPAGNRRRRRNGVNPAGPGWVAGQDGAQNAKLLRRRMRMQERRQLQQYDQAMTQVKEQQQQDYEKSMLQKLGSQRPAIKQGHKDVEQIRNETGANK